MIRPKVKLLLLSCFVTSVLWAQNVSKDIFINQRDVSNIYNDGWIDLNKNGYKDVYEDVAQPIEDRIEDLLARMTIEEKTMQLATLYGYGRVLEDELPTEAWQNEVWKDGLANIDEHLNGVTRHPHAVTEYSFPASKHSRAINETQRFFIEETRLGIPVDFTNEGIRGLCHHSATGFPSQIGIGSTWNSELVFEIGSVTGKEAKSTGYSNVYSPVLDLARDPRWGRVVECYSEDAFLVSELGKEMVNGIQSQGVASTVKHFAVYSAPKGGRDGDVRTDPHVAPREMHQMYLRPFEEVVKESGVMGIMSSYNDYDGIPVSASSYFLTDILRNSWGFDGYVVSDSWAIGGLVGRHKVARDFKESINLAINAGLNVRTNFTPTHDFVTPLRALISEGAITESTLNDRVRDVLRVKFKLGLFDSPYTTNPDNADDVFGSDVHRAVSLRASRESIVLLKNEQNLLPLNPSVMTSILVTGPNAKDIEHSISRYGPSNIEVTSVYQGIKDLIGSDLDIRFAEGCKFFDDNWPENELYELPISEEEQNMINDAVEMARSVDVIIAAVGDNYETVGESRSRTSLDLPGNQKALLEALYETGKPIVVVLLNGRAMSVNWTQKHIPAIVEAWNPGPFGGQAVAEVIFGKYNPGGKLPVTFPKTVGQLPFNFPFKRNSQAGQPIEGPNGRGNTRINGALYPFGFGLSYTTFKYSDLEIRKDLIEDGKLEVVFKVTNAGILAGDEVAQLYITDEYSSVVTYESVLRGFERISLEAGETKQIQMIVTPADFSLINQDWNKIVEKGVFTLKIGSSSEDIRLEKEINVSQDILLE